MRRVDHERLRAGREHFCQRRAQCRDERIDIRQFPARDSLAQRIKDVLRRIDADVGRQEPRLKLIEDVGIYSATTHELRNIQGQPGVAPVEPRAQTCEEARGVRAASRLGSEHG